MSSRMVRELADISDALRAVPPPPLPVLAAPYSMRFADPVTDAAMISEWMNRPHLAETWHYDYPDDQWRRHLEIQFEGSYSRPYIYSFGSRPIGYIELFRAARDDLATVYDADPHDIGLHGAAADVAMIEKGHGRNVFRSMAPSIFGGDPHCRRIIGDTVPDKDAYGRRFWERIGGVFVGEPYIARWERRAALFAWLREPEDAPTLRDAARR